MNILIYFANQLNPLRGGTERVACLLADYFIQKGHNVRYMAFRKVEQPESRLTDFLPDGNESSSFNNVKFLSDYIEINKIDIIINEGASTESIYLFSHEYISQKIKIINHVHFDITGDLDHLWRTQYFPLIGVPPMDSIKNVLRRIKYPYNKWRGFCWKKQHFRYMYLYSDAIVVLSDIQKNKLLRLLRLSRSPKIYGLMNPNSVVPKEIQFNHKSNTILYVGRLDYGQKRVDRVLKVWNKIYKKIPDWKLSIAGFGPFKGFYETLTVKLNLERVEFLGQVDPSKYYNDSKILVLTSNFEGTPMVIPECMSYGVVPIVMNTFSDASMYIADRVNGFLTKPFSINSMAKTLLELTKENGKGLEKIGYAAKQTIDNIDNNATLSIWSNLLDVLLTKTEVNDY